MMTMFDWWRRIKVKAKNWIKVSEVLSVFSNMFVCGVFIMNKKLLWHSFVLSPGEPENQEVWISLVIYMFGLKVFDTFGLKTLKSASKLWPWVSFYFLLKPQITSKNTAELSVTAVSEGLRSLTEITSKSPAFKCLLK